MSDIDVTLESGQDINATIVTGPAIAVSIDGTASVEVSFAGTSYIEATIESGEDITIELIEGVAGSSGSSGSSGTSGNTDYATSAGNAGSAVSATTAAYAGTAYYAISAPSAGVSGTATFATTAANAGTSSFATTSSIAGTSPYSGTSSKATSAGYAGTTYYAQSAGQAGTAYKAASAGEAGTAWGARRLGFYVKAGEAIKKGQAVYIYSATGNNPVVKLADNTDATKCRIAGLASQDLALNAFGFIRRAGELDEVDTSATGYVNADGGVWAAGTLLFLTTGGKYSQTRPTSGRSVKVAYVLESAGLDTLLVIPFENPVWVNAARTENIVLRMGGATDGTTRVSFRNYANTELAYFDDLGQWHGTGATFGTIGYATTSGTASKALSAGTSGRADSAGKAASSDYAGTSYMATSAANAGSASSATTAANAGTSYKATSAANSGSASYATTAAKAGTAPYAGTAYKATSAAGAGTAYYATSTWGAYNASYAGTTGYASSAYRAGTAPYAGTASVASSAVNASTASKAASAAAAGTSYYADSSGRSGTSLRSQLSGTASYSTAAGTADFATSSGDAGTSYKAATAAEAGSAAYAGTAYYAESCGNAGSGGGGGLSTGGTADYAISAGTAAYAASAGNGGGLATGGTAAYSLSAGTAAKADLATSAGNAGSAGSATTAANAGTSYYAASAAYAGTALYAESSGAGGATSSGTSGTSGTSGIGLSYKGAWVGTSGTAANYPPDYTSTYVKATSEFAGTGYAGYNVFNPDNPLTGDIPNWVTNNVNANVRINVDLGSAVIINKVDYENYHKSGTKTDRGVQHFTMQGSNDASSFNQTAYATDTGWVNLDSSISALEQHAAADSSDPKSFTVNNTNAYRYYSFKCADNYGDANFAAIRRIVLQTISGASYSLNDVVLDNSVYICTEAHFPSSDNEPGVGTDWEDYWDLFIPSGSSGTSATALVSAFGLSMDGAGTTISTGIKGYITIPFSCTVQAWYLVGDTAGDLVIDVWKKAGALPTVADTIAGTEKPTLSGTAYALDSNLTTWGTLGIAAGDVIAFNVDSAGTVQKATLSIRFTQ